MKQFDVHNFLNEIKFGKGFIKNKIIAKEYIDIGYSPTKLLLHFDIADEALLYILSVIATSNEKLN